MSHLWQYCRLILSEVLLLGNWIVVLVILFSFSACGKSPVDSAANDGEILEIVTWQHSDVIEVNGEKITLTELQQRDIASAICPNLSGMAVTQRTDGLPKPVQEIIPIVPGFFFFRMVDPPFEARWDCIVKGAEVLRLGIYTAGDVWVGNIDIGVWRKPTGDFCIALNAYGSVFSGVGPCAVICAPTFESAWDQASEWVAEILTNPILLIQTAAGVVVWYSFKHVKYLLDLRGIPVPAL